MPLILLLTLLVSFNSQAYQDINEFIGDYEVVEGDDCTETAKIELRDGYYKDGEKFLGVNLNGAGFGLTCSFHFINEEPYYKTDLCVTGGPVIPGCWQSHQLFATEHGTTLFGESVKNEYIYLAINLIKGTGLYELIYV